MNSPTIDILVPVWNNPFETRACLATILKHSTGIRLIIVDNGSSRETELMLEEFSESMGDQGLFIKSEKNVGLVAAINLGLARSDSDYTVIVRVELTFLQGRSSGRLAQHVRDLPLPRSLVVKRRNRVLLQVLRELCLICMKRQ